MSSDPESSVGSHVHLSVDATARLMVSLLVNMPCGSKARAFSTPTQLPPVEENAFLN